MTPADRQRQTSDDAAKAAIRFMVLKAAIFIVVPLLAAVIAVMITLK